jgi:hypothetical protein
MRTERDGAACLYRGKASPDTNGVTFVLGGESEAPTRPCEGTFVPGGGSNRSKCPHLYRGQKYPGQVTNQPNVKCSIYVAKLNSRSSHYPMLCFVREPLGSCVCTHTHTHTHTHTYTTCCFLAIGLPDNTSMQDKKGNAILLCAELVLFYKGINA